jgi:excisionase family DNA binding protein
MTEQLLTRADLAKLFHCSLSTILRFEKQGKLKPVRLGEASIRYRRQDIEQFLTAGCGRQ